MFQGEKVKQGLPGPDFSNNFVAIGVKEKKPTEKDALIKWIDISIELTRELTLLPLDKMAAILADDTFKRIFLNEKDRIPIRISLKFVPRSSVDNKPALVQAMAWRRTGDKPLPEPKITLFTDAYMRH